jgi:uncharacterized protein (DUF2267 family)
VQANNDASMRDIIEPEDAVVVVLNVLNSHIGGGELTKVAANMPEPIKRLFKEAGVEVRKTSPTEMATPAQ